MKHSLPSLESLKAFEAAARHLNFSIAAEELCISKGAISYQIRKLEEQIQCTLFKRSIRQVYLTDSGQTLYQTTKQLFQDLQNSLSKIQESTQQASVSIAATTYVSARWLSSRISRFNEEYPNINILLRHSVNSADFKLDDVDIAIHWETSKNTQQKNRLAEIPLPLFPALSPALMSSHGMGSHSKIDIKKLITPPFCDIPLLCEDRTLDLWQAWFEQNKPKGMDAKLMNPRRIISDANVRVQAAVDGQGIILSDDMMSYELDNGLLVSPFKETLKDYGYALLSSPARIYSENAQTLKDWLVLNI